MADKKTTPISQQPKVSVPLHVPAVGKSAIPPTTKIPNKPG